jgi:hypothetical protein
MAEDLSKRTMTAPLAVIKINGYQSGFMRNVRITENIQRGEVKGIGNLFAQEIPATGYTCSLSCDFFFISLRRPELRAFINRDQGLDSLINTLILGELPIQIQVFKKVKVQESNGIITQIDPEGETIAAISDFYPESNGLDITENQISGSNISGRYLTPIFFNQQ